MLSLSGKFEAVVYNGIKQNDLPNHPLSLFSMKQFRNRSFGWGPSHPPHKNEGSGNLFCATFDPPDPQIEGFNHDRGSKKLETFKI